MTSTEQKEEKKVDILERHNIDTILANYQNPNIKRHIKDELTNTNIMSLPPHPVTLRELKNGGIKNKQHRETIMDAIYASQHVRQAWLSAETSIDDINVMENHFSVSGIITIFWKDTQFGGDVAEALRNDNTFPFGTYDTFTINIGDEKEEKIEKIKVVDLLLDYRDKDKVKKYLQNDTKTEKSRPFIPLYTKKNEDCDTDSVQKYINLTRSIDVLKNKLRYKFPFYTTFDDKKAFILFANNLEEIEPYAPNGITTDTKLHFNINKSVFKMQIGFKGKFFEVFENNFNEFPFESQFLNVKIPYNRQYQFAAQIPKDFQEAYCFAKNWKHAKDIWENCVLVRKIETLGEWLLLKPWVDFRRVREDYGYEFDYGLIKYRVQRNPAWHMSYIIAPLFLMGICSFAVFLIEYDDVGDRLAYLVTLLLTVTAFQFSISEGLPYKTQLTLIDEYFLVAYLMLVVLILETVLVATTWNFDRDLLEIISCVIIAVIWMNHSVKFLFKYITVFGMSKDTFKGTVNAVFIIFGIDANSWWSYGLCCCTVCSCGDWCRRKKTKITLKRWMVMEKNECAEFDNMRKFGDQSRKAQLIMGTKGDIYNQYENEEAKYVEWTNWDPLEDEVNDEWKDSVPLRLRHEIVKKLHDEEQEETNCCSCISCPTEVTNCCLCATEHEKIPTNEEDI